MGKLTAHYYRLQTLPPEDPPEVDWTQGDEFDDEEGRDRDGEHYDGPVDDDDDEDWNAQEPPDYQR